MKTTDIQQALVYDGYDLGTTGPNHDGVDDDPGPKTFAALEDYRGKHGWQLDLGPLTEAGLQGILDAEAEDEGTDADGATVVPEAWMPDCKMSRIIFHWTAGNYTPSSDDKTHYHILVDGNAVLVKGTHSIADNVSTADGVYAAHTKDLNGGSIGVSACCMVGAVESPFSAGSAPLKKEQWEMLAVVGADLCRHYKIPVGLQTTLTHGEVQANTGVVQSGKWDINRLPWDSAMNTARKCGDALRALIQAEL